MRALVAIVPLLVGEAWASSEPIINQQVKRSFYLNTAVIREELSIVVFYDPTHSAAGSHKEVHNYRLVIPPKVAEHFASGTATYESMDLPLQETTGLKDTGACLPIGSRCFSLNLPRPLSASNPKAIFGIGLSYTNMLQARPSFGSALDPNQVFFSSSPYFFSPYPTLKQKASIIMAREVTAVRIKCPTPNHLESSPVANMPNAMEYNCGVYNSIDSLHNKEDILSVQFTAPRLPLFHFENLERRIRVDLLRKVLVVEDNYVLFHDGHRPKEGWFNKAEYVQRMMRQQEPGQILAVIPMIVPAMASEVQVRDEVGLLTGNVQRRPAPSAPKAFHLLEIQPRNVLAGGWNLSWKLSYTLPLAVYLEKTANGLRLVLSLFELYHDVSIDRLSLSVTLPVGVSLAGVSVSKNFEVVKF